MSLPSITQARDEIQALFNNAWTANTPAVTPGNYVPQVRWDGVPENPNESPPNDACWARFKLNHNNSVQSTLGQKGARRFTRSGVLAVQVFAPIDGGGFSLAEKLAIIARDCYEGQATVSGVWFRTVTIKEIGPDPGGWFQMNVTATFEYDEIK